MAGSNAERSAERQDALAHSYQSETQSVVRPQSAAVVAHAHQGAAPVPCSAPAGNPAGSMETSTRVALAWRKTFVKAS